MFGCTTEFRLRDILEGLTRDQHIIAQDVKNKNGDIIKRYIKGPCGSTQTIVGKPTWLGGPHWYEICLERPTRLFMDIESTAPADVVQRGLTAICKYIEYDLKVVPEVISSCSEQTVIPYCCTSVFKNVYHVGMGAQMLSVYANADCRQQRKSRGHIPGRCSGRARAGASLIRWCHAQSRISHVWLIQTRVPSRVDPSTSCMARLDGAARAASRCGTVDSVGIR